MQLCQIHFYQKIACKKVARVNTALVLEKERNHKELSPANKVDDAT